nr:hypothetical protein [Candidatus Thorarchaeota archaeon]NIW13210.1 hypothetical protein [Candidatus Thorarchaeota archaeon]NIW51349.1 hypothetical protein [Candidatus Korarchaeota archaeon]
MIKVYQDYPHELLEKRWPNISNVDPDLREYVSKIVEDVRVRGDDAVTYYSKKFDNVEMQKKDLTVKKEEIEESYNDVTTK